MGWVSTVGTWESTSINKKPKTENLFFAPKSEYLRLRDRSYLNMTYANIPSL
ncbi:MAG: hypothetical protein O4805_05125 [Trichodesmium sp. St16_bin2-tuft]|nr:hypothetical protein [Trichodesmium sp. St16_bin2-tuft]